MASTAFASQNNGGPRLNGFPDQFGAQTFTSQQVNTLFQYLGNPGLKVSDGETYSAPTLAEYFNNKTSTELASFIAAGIVDGSGWAFRFAPPRQAQMNNQINIFEMDEYIAKEAPEGAPYEETSYSQRSVFSKLKLQKLGGKMPAAFFAFGEKEAADVMAAQARKISNSFWNNARLRIATALVTARDIHREKSSTSSAAARNLTEATQIERDDFACLQTNSNGLAHLHHSSSAILLRANRVPNMAVVPPGVLDGIALIPKNTEASGVGETKASANIRNAGREVAGMFQGLTIYEDAPISVVNSPNLENVSVFQMPVQVGEYNFIGPAKGHAYSFEDPNKLTCQIYDHKSWSWVTISIRDVIVNNLDLRWDENGALAREHADVPRTLTEIATLRNLRSVGKNVDPFFSFSEDAANADAENGGFFQIQHWGEANLEFLGVDRVIGTAKAIFKKVSNEMKEVDVKNILRLKRIAQDLQNPPDIDNKILQAFNAAISIQNNVNEGAPYLAINEYGVPYLPSIDGDGEMTVKVDGKDKVVAVQKIADTQPGANDIKTRIVSFFDKGDVAGEYEVVDTYPSKPFGYGTFPGLRYLASLRTNSLGFDNWQLLIEEISECIESVEKFCAILAAYFPRTPLTDVRKLPDYLRSGNESYDKTTMIWSSVIDKTFHPYMVKVPTYSRDKKTMQVRSVNAGDLGFVPLSLPGTLRSDINIDRLPFSAPVYEADTGRNLANDITLIQALFYSARFPSELRHAFTSKEAYTETSNSLRSRRQFLLPLVRAQKLNAFPFNDSEHLLVALLATIGEINPSTVQVAEYADRRASAVYVLLKGSLSRAVTREDLISIMDNPVVGNSAPIPVPLDEPALAVAGGAAVNTIDIVVWKISRLVYRPQAWQDSLNKRSWKWLDANLTRPSNPLRPLYPLAGSYFIASIDNDNKKKEASVAIEASRNSIEKLAKSHRDLDAQSGLKRMFGGYNDNWIDTPAGQAFLTREKELLDPQTWHDSLGGSLFSQDLDDLVKWNTIMTTDAQGRERIQLVNKPHLRARLDAIEQRITEEPVKWFARALLVSEVHRDNVMALLDHGIAPLFCSYLFIRPFETVIGSMAIWAFGGDTTARLNWNYAQAFISLNPIHEMWNFHYNAWMDCLIIDNTAFISRYNVVVQGYSGGRDTIPFTNPQQLIATAGPHTLNASMFVFCLGGEITSQSLPECISIEGALDQRDFPYSSFREADGLFNDSQLQLPIAYGITRFKLHLLNDGRPRFDPFVPADRKREQRFNTRCWPGPQLDWNSASQRYADAKPGNSHWSKFGCDPLLNLSGICRGQIATSPFLKSAQYVN